MSSLTDAFNRAATGRKAPDPFAYKDNQADGFKAEDPGEGSADDQADGYKGPPEDEAIEVMRPLRLKRAKKKIVL